MMVCAAVAPRALLLFWLLDALLFANASRPKDGEHVDASSLILASSGHMVSSSHKAATDSAAKPGPDWAEAFTSGIRELSDSLVRSPGEAAQAERKAKYRFGNVVAQTGSHEVAGKKQLQSFKQEITKDPALAAHSKVAVRSEDEDEVTKQTSEMLKAAGYPDQQPALDTAEKVPAPPQIADSRAQGTKAAPSKVLEAHASAESSHIDEALQTLAFRSKAAAKGDKGSKAQKDIEHTPIAKDIQDVRQSAVEEAQKSIMSIPHV